MTAVLSEFWKHQRGSRDASALTDVSGGDNGNSPVMDEIIEAIRRTSPSVRPEDAAEAVLCVLSQRLSGGEARDPSGSGAWLLSIALFALAQRPLRSSFARWTTS